MPNCCSETPLAQVAPGVVKCPGCDGPGRPVLSRTLKHMVKPQFLAIVANPGFLFCSSPHCEVVYFHPDGQQLRKVDVRVRVGLKETDDSAALCYCFGFTRTILFQELHTAGQSQIPKVISAELSAGNCACEVRNPQGSCCLGNIAAAIKTWQKMCSQTSKSSVLIKSVTSGGPSGSLLG